MTRRLLAIVFVLAVVAAACGGRGDDDDAAPTDGGATATTEAAPAESDAGVTDTEILLGATVTLSGPTGFLGEEVVGAITAYFEKTNAAGGINGRKLRLITYDDGGDASQLLANIRKLVEQDKVLALITGLADNALDYVDSKKIPTLTFGVSPTAFASKYPTVFPIVGNALLWTQEIIAGLQENDVFEAGMKVGMIYDNGFLDMSPYLDALEQSWENAGAEVVSIDPFTLETGSCESLVLKYRDLGVEWWDFQSAAWFLCVQAAGDQGFKPRVGWGGWPASVPTIATIAGPAIDGVWGGSNGDQPDGAPRGPADDFTREFLDALEMYAPDLVSPAHLDSPATLGYWAGAKLLVDAISAQGDVITQDGITEWIQSVEDYEIGVTPNIVSMAPDCKTGSESVWIGQWVWDDVTKTASRTPAGGYFTSPQKEEFGGQCFLTKLSDEILAG
ncbi:MAG TPA: ABC transporter substrate-binding protein [Acidimicrobiales bacterium]|nr:ABC transporter substrate-binding protein [Acidimicrobiales bacterium]